MPPSPSSAAAATPLCIRGEPLLVVRQAQHLAVTDVDGRVRSRWSWLHSGQEWGIAPEGGAAVTYADLLAVLQTVFLHVPQVKSVNVELPQEPAAALCRAGLLLRQGARHVAVAELIWQHAAGWLPLERPPFPVQQVMSEGKRHPLRPPKPEGEVYRRYLPWLGQTLTLRSLRLEEDLALFNRWMNDPVVVQFWDEAGDLARHRRYLDTIAADPHMTSLIASFDDRPFAYFEVYWAKENRIAPFYDCGDFDRGWHVLVGEEAFRGKQFAVAWLTSISHYLFLDDCRTQTVVGEPRADHEKQIRNLDKSGYAKLKEFDFPHKRAMLVILSRERYFGQGLWQPQTALAPLDPPFFPCFP